MFLHAKWGAATAYISGNRGDIFYVDHFHGFFSNCSCSSLKIDFLCDRKNKYIILSALSLHDKRFKRLLYRCTCLFGRVQSVNKFITFILNDLIRNFIFIKNTHGICLYFFAHIKTSFLILIGSLSVYSHVNLMSRKK